ncbi:MAG: molybdenum cofactor biosynthesis protein MoaE [Chloroflexota bacterium]|nr:molybdenum cofactor biosynthesis protein MoaE [Chloroflexota bacterium]
MRVHVKFFAIFREMVGVKTEWVEIADGTTVEALWKQYAARNARLVNLRAAYAVNQKLAKPDQVLREGDEVGFLPPVSGGAQQVKSKKAKGKSKISADSRDSRVKEAFITRQPLDLNALVGRVAFSGAGAILTFSGVVRDNARGKAVKHLDYETYPEMAESTMRDIVAEVHQRWHDARVAMAHRIGRLKVGEASLIIAVAAPHRAEAYAASHYAIERVKQILPVWKKEFASDGDHWVEGPIAGETPPEEADEIARGEAEYTPF